MNKPPRVGSLFSGYGGLEMGLTLAGVDHEMAFVADPAPAAAAALDRHHPGVPNLGDITELTTLPECDILLGGAPCQPVSQAGLRKGLDNERWLFEVMFDLVEEMDTPPGVLWLENVIGILSANSGEAFRTILVRLADLGYDAEWTVVRASEAGAPHQRKRWFLLAWQPDAHPCSVGWGPWAGSQAGAATEVGRHRSGDADRTAPAYPDRVGQQGWPTINGADREVEVESRHDTPRRTVDFDKYTGAVERWERLTRPAPPPLDDSTPGRLNPAFSEWMMGLPAGHCTDLELSRKRTLELIGNGVCPQQAAVAWTIIAQPAATGVQPEMFPATNLPTPLNRDHKDSPGTTAPANGYLARVIRDLTGGPR